MQEPLTLYKLMILYILDSVSQPLKKTMVTDCIIDQGYTDYMTVQTAIGELRDTGFLKEYREGKSTWLASTPDGERTLSLFLGSLSDGVRKDLRDYLTGHNQEIRESRSILANYQRTPNGEFEATLIARDRGNKLMELKITVPDEETANHVCTNWQEKNADLYAYLVKELF